MENIIASRSLEDIIILATINPIKRYVKVRAEKNGRKIPCFSRDNNDVGELSKKFELMTKKEYKNSLKKLVKSQIDKAVSKKMQKEQKNKLISVLSQQSSYVDGKKEAMELVSTFPISLLLDEEYVNYCWENSKYGLAGKNLTKKDLKNLKIQDNPTTEGNVMENDEDDRIDDIILPDS